MGRILTQHPDVAFWHEPRPIWMHGNAYRSHYELGAEDLTPRIARYIDRKFDSFLKESGKSRFAEKTPSNAFRIPFIHALYPDCKVVNIIRDGRNVVRSIMQISKGQTPTKKIGQRLSQSPPWEWPAYLPMFFRTFWRTRILGKEARYWGPKPKGWQQWKDLPRHLLAAEQWRAVVEAIIEHGRSLPKENYFEIRYESFMETPVEIIRRMLTFAELPQSDAVEQYTASQIDPNRSHKWKGTLTDEQEREIEERMRPTLMKLGYINESEPVAEPRIDAIGE